jgi:hypothetical protein
MSLSLATEAGLRQHEKMLVDFAAELPAAQRAFFEANGLGHVPRDFNRRAGLRDLSERGDLAAPEPDKQPEVPASAERVHEALRRVIGEILADSQRNLGIECLSLATGICYAGNSEAEIARRNGVTRAAVSKRVRALCKLLHLPPSRAMRSLTAVKTYAHRATAIHHARDSSFLRSNGHGPKVRHCG